MDALPTSADIERLLDHVRVAQNDSGAVQELITEAIEYVKRGKGKEVHRFCSDGGAPPDFELQTCMLRLFSFKRKGVIAEWIDGLAEEYGTCVDCYKGFVAAKENLRARYLNTYPDETLRQFFDFVDAWERDVALELLRKRGITAGGGLGSLSPPTVYAVLSTAAHECATDLRDTLKAAMTPHKLHTLTEVPPGLLLFAVDSDSKPRQWAAVQLPGLKGKEDKSNALLKSAIADIARKLATQQQSPDRTTALWEGLPIVLQLAPSSAASFSPHILGHLHDRGDHFASVLHAFDLVLASRGSDLWKSLNEDNEFPLLILDSILDNSAYARTLMRPEMVGNLEKREQFLSWISLYCDTLNGAMFGEALARLANFLCEKLQHAQYASTCCAMALEGGVKLVQRYFVTSPGDASEGPEAEERTKAINKVVNLYASNFAAVALGSATVQASARAVAQRLLLQVFERDTALVSAAIFELSNLATQVHKQFKHRRRSDKQGRTLNENAPLAEDIIESAANQRYPNPAGQICTELWKQAYQSLTSRSGKEGAALFVTAVAQLASFAMPRLEHHLLPTREQSKHYDQYEKAVKASIDSVRQSLKVTRGDFGETITDFAEVASEDVLQVLCLDTADNLIILNLSPDPTVHKAAQTVVRQAFPDAESRADCFRYLLQSSGDLSLRGLVRFLGSFVQAASTMVEANDLAKWMVRSFADIVEVLCSSTDGLLRPGTPFSLVDDQNSRRAVQAQLPDLWRLMCQSVSEIFKRTPSWATLLARDELVAWFRDVTIFASELVDQVSTFELAMRTGRRERMKQITDDEGDMVQDLALPLENTMTWLRMNDQEILGAVVDFINKTLDRFQDSNVDLPEGKERLLSFIEIQLQEPNESKRQTLLSAEQLTDLKHRLLGTVIITDGSEEEDLPTEVAPPPSSSQPFWESIGTPQKASPASQERKRKLKQQKLSFAKATPSAVIDVDALPDRQASKSAAASSSATNRVAPRPTIADKVAASASLNKFKAATSSSTSSSVASKQPAVRPGGKVSQLRQEFASTRQWKPTNVNQRAPVRRPSPVNEVEPRAPAAVSSVTGAFAGKKPPMQPAASRQAAASDSSDSSSSDDEPETRGLQSLVKDQKSPIKMRFKPTKPVQRRTILMEEDPARLRALREKQEAERKRRLRSAPDFSGLHRSILAWDFYHEGEQPPAVAPVQYVSVPNTFTSPSHYGSIFGPLLFLECWAQFQQAKEEMERDRSTVQVIPVDITGRSTVDSFIDVTATIPPNAILPSFYFADTDIVFLRERPDPGVPRPARPRIVLAKVQAFKKHPQGHQLTLRCFLAEDRQGVSSTLTNRSKWELGKLFTLTTLNREFAALSTAEYYDLIPDVLAARAAKKVVLPADEVKKAMSAYQVNEPQASAILGSLRTQGFAMIQGPPGTGKTKTICGLVGAFISTRRAPTTSVQAGRPQAQSAAGPSKKMLVCAPSNAAIDEVAKRVKAGMRDASGKMVYPKVVRIGNDNAINVSVKDIALDNLVDERMGAAGPTTDTSALHAEIRSLRDAREKKQTELSQVKNNPALVSQLEAEIRNLSSQRMAVMARLDEAKDKQQSTARQQDADRRRHRHDVLFEADVICSTLAGAGHEMLNQLPFDFETVVIDEAAQAVELSALIPLRYGCQRCILVGDPNQLPPTVISGKADRLKYSQSLFVRMFNRSPDQVYLLSIQYRMHPDISVFPSTTFYDSKLQDGPGMAQLTAQPWHSNPLFRPFKFFASRGLEAAGRSHSLINREEAAIAQAIYERLRQDHPKVDFDYRIGIVTMYKEQVFELKRVFRARYGADIDSVIDFNTVDGFQGQEKDIIILSCVRGGKGTVGFLSDRRRVNVALTRAKSNMFVIGNAEHLRNDRLWGQLVVQSEARGALQPANVKTFSGVSRPAPAPARQPPTQKARPPQGQPPPPPPAGLATPKQLAQRYGADQSSPNAKKRAAPDAQNDESSNPAKKSRVPSGNSSARPSEDSLFDGPLSSNNPSKTSSPAPGSRHSSAGPRPDRRGPATVPPRERAAGDARGHGPPGRHTGRPDDPNGRPNRPPPGGPHGPNGQPARPSGSGPGAQPPRPPAPPPQKRPPPVSAAPPKPSNKALDAMFVKKRR